MRFPKYRALFIWLITSVVFTYDLHQICSHYAPTTITSTTTTSSSSNTLIGISSKTILHNDNNFNNPLEPIIAQQQQQLRIATSTAKSANNNKAAASSQSQQLVFDVPPPIFGQHNPTSDAVLVFAYGYKPPPILRFVESLIDTGYDGDIVLGVNYEKMMKSLGKNTKGGEDEKKKKKKGDSDDDGGSSSLAFKRYLEHRSKHHHLVVYDVKLECDPKNPTLCTAPYMYQNILEDNEKKSQSNNNHSNNNHNNSQSSNKEFLPDPRIARSVKLLRYEYYWAWSTNYVDVLSVGNNRIFVSDVRDVYFQSNPFNVSSSTFASQELASTTVAGAGDDNVSRGNKQHQTSLQVFVEDTSMFTIATQTSNARWIRATKGEKVLEKIGHNRIVCSGTTLGGAVAIESYLRAIIEEFDNTQCDIDGCDQGLHNYLLYSGRLLLANGATTAAAQSDPNNNNNIATTNVIDYTDGTNRLALKVMEHSNNNNTKLTISPTAINNSKRSRINRIEFFSLGYGPVNTVGLFCGFGGKGVLRKNGLLRQNEDNVIPVVLNWDGMVTPVIHQIDRCAEISNVLERKADLLWQLIMEGSFF